MTGPAQPGPVQAAGPLGKLIRADSTRVRPTAEYPQPSAEFRTGANALIMMRRVAFLKVFDDGTKVFNDGTRKLDEDAGRALLHWAATTGLGQESGLVRQVAERRTQLVRQLRARGRHVIRLTARPEWRLAVGLGDKANPHEIGLSLHGTYGWPVIPGSSLKGLVAAWAGDSPVATSAEVKSVLGTPDSAGSVCFLDAIPAGGPEPVNVVIDVLTPHVKRYYETTGERTQGPAEPPAEYHSPVPVKFLTVTGPFSVDLYGPNAASLVIARDWLIKAGDELGAGAKTAAGYGYLSITQLGEDE
ncbi:MAG TPA: type III-B CRISPR module RAMP protein Cmr6 [Streptosporangiaceae bacterium]|nr:type III-B CRISPR module RAMP protein Cmr6 [Streptosporangiaceae bacterium]